MPKSRNFKPRDDALISRLEDLLLAAPLGELAAASRKAGAVDDVRRIIDDRLAAAEVRAARHGRRSSPPGTNPSILGRGMAQRSPARAVFSKDDTSAQDKVDKLISNLAGNRKESKRNKK